MSSGRWGKSPWTGLRSRWWVKIICLGAESARRRPDIYGVRTFIQVGGQVQLRKPGRVRPPPHSVTSSERWNLRCWTTPLVPPKLSLHFFCGLSFPVPHPGMVVVQPKLLDLGIPKNPLVFTQPNSPPLPQNTVPEGAAGCVSCACTACVLP